MVACDSAIVPVSSSLSGGDYQAADMIRYLKASVTKLVVISGEQLLANHTNAKALNVALLGAAAQTGALPFDGSDIENTIREKIPERFLQMNLDALDLGRRMYDETVGSD